MAFVSDIVVNLLAGSCEQGSDFWRPEKCVDEKNISVCLAFSD